MSQKVAVVTGGNKGIGYAIVAGLCKQHYPGDVILTARNEKMGLETVENLKKEGLEAIFHQLDITDTASIEKLKNYLMQNYGGLDVLVNNAGIAFKVNATEPFGVQAEVTMKTNFFGTLEVSRILLPIIKPHGRVVNVSSFVSQRCLNQCSPELQAQFRSATITEEQLVDLMNKFVQDAKNGDHQVKGWPNSAYGVSKIGVTVMSQIHARLLSQQRPADKILLNSCCPGWVRTDMAGPKALKSPEEGAETPLYLALLPLEAQEPHGQLVSEKKVEEW